jgi:hypothetical protein
VQLEGFGKFKNPPHPRTEAGDLQGCSIVPQRNTLPHAPRIRIMQIYKRALVLQLHRLETMKKHNKAPEDFNNRG